MKTDKHNLGLTMSSLVTLASIISVKQWKQEPKLKGQGQRDKVNMDKSRNLAEKWIWDKGSPRCEEGFIF